PHPVPPLPLGAIWTVSGLHFITLLCAAGPLPQPGLAAPLGVTFIGMAQILDGVRVRDAILDECRPRVAALRRPPGLAVVLVGHDPASEIYVRNKVKACAELGIHSETLSPPDSISTGELLAIVDELNRRPEIDGILVQMPLPPQVDSKQVLLAVSPEKDVDGFHPCNIGALATGRPGPKSCTPAGIIRLLQHYQIPITGRHAVVV